LIIAQRLRGYWSRMASDDADLAREAAFARTATAALAGLFGPAMLALPADRLNWQIWGCLALVLPLMALSQVAARRSASALTILGLLGSAIGALCAGWPGFQVLACWSILAPIETAIILAAARTHFGALFTLALTIGLAIAERIGLTAAESELIIAAMFAASAAIPGALLTRRIHAAARARRLREWSINQRRATLSASGELFVWLDASGKALDVGPEFAQAMNLDEEDLQGEGLFNRIHVADRPQFLHTFNRAQHSNETTIAAVRLRSGVNARGTENSQEPRFLWFEARMRRLASRGRTDQAAVVVALRNTTDVKEIEQRLESVRSEAAAAITVKDRLLANVSHELRTPLNAILGFSEILGDVDLAPKTMERRLEYAQIIHASAQHLLSVVNLLLDMSKLQAGRYEIDPEAFEVGPLIRGCVDMLSLKAKSGGVEILETPPPLDFELIADKRACRQILLNLLSNAVKFTPDGGQVAVEVEIVGDKVEISVADTGIGIAKEHLPRIGDPFFQARSGFDRVAEGAGLGLALVRGLVGLHGGSLAIESAPGIGTRVVVRLPIKGCDATQGGSTSANIETFSRVNFASKLGKRPVEAERKIA
jgi:cell cycle sensor histidine kinase DivJ